MTNSQLAKQEKLAQRERLVNQLLWIPLVILLGIIPLIVKVVNVPLTDAALSDAINATEVVDFFSNVKSTWIMIISVMMAVILFLVADRSKIKWDKTVKWYAIGGGIFIGVSLLSTIFSDYTSVAWWGMPDRSEGFMMTACYILMMVYTMYSLMNYKNYIYIMVALGILVVATTIIGAFQYAGYDLFSNVEFIKNLVLSEEYKELGANITSIFEKGKVYGTMFHYNYVGSFGAMMVPFFITLTLFMRNKWIKLFSAIMTICSMFLLFGSTSRAGIIGLGLATLVGIIVFGKVIVKKWKITVPVVAVLVVIVLGFNAITGGTIFSRIPTLMNDIVSVFVAADKDFDYRDHIPVKELVNEDGKMKIVFQDQIIYINNVDNNPVFTDEAGNEIEYALNIAGEISDLDTVFMTQDERYKDITFTYAKVTGLEEGQEAPVILRMGYKGKDTFLFLLNAEKGVVLADACPIQEIEIEDPETFGFNGKEKLGSARGYIWSRSIPLMKDAFLIGNGPDTFAIEFPQHDFLGKWWAYGTPNMIVDKVHNLYLAIFINNGGLALVGFLIMMIVYLVQSFKLYALKGYYEQKHILGIATALAVLGYLGAGIFNDSVVAVAPVFWILLGAGMGVNYLVKKEQVGMGA